MLSNKSQAARIALAVAALALSLSTAAFADRPGPVPEPGTFGLIGVGLAGVYFLFRRRRS